MGQGGEDYYCPTNQLQCCNAQLGPVVVINTLKNGLGNCEL